MLRSTGSVVSPLPKLETKVIERGKEGSDKTTTPEPKVEAVLFRLNLFCCWSYAFFEGHELSG